MFGVLKQMHQCPYCRNGHGSVAIDLTALSAYTVPPRTAASVIGAGVPRIVCFDFATQPRPCRHVVSFDLQGTFKPLSRRAEWEREARFDSEWDDPWLALHDAGGYLRSRIRHAMRSPDNGPVHPWLPHRFDRVEQRWPWLDPRWQLQVVGQFAVAEEPLAFLTAWAEQESQMTEIGSSLYGWGIHDCVR